MKHAQDERGNGAAEILSGRFVSRPVEDVRFGPGSVKQLGEALDQHGCRRALIITGRSLRRQDAVFAGLEAQLGDRCAGIFADAAAHVPRGSVMRAAEMAQRVGADALVSIGGSTPHDTAKATAWALAEDLHVPADFDRYMAEHGTPSAPAAGLTGTPLPLFAVPTTLSGGEFNSAAGITDETRRTKDLVRAPALTFKAVFLDPTLTVFTPDWLWLSSGVKAIDHCVEALLSINAQPMTDALALRALDLLFRHLPATRRNPQDVGARGRCQIATWLSVAGLANVSLGLSHGLGHQLGGIAKTPHGYTSCVLLPHVLTFNRPATQARQAELGRSLGLAPAADDEAGAIGFQQAIDQLIRDELGLPHRLRDVGVSREDLGAVARAAIHDRLTATNPRKVGGEADIAALLQQAW